MTPKFKGVNCNLVKTWVCNVGMCIIEFISHKIPLSSFKYLCDQGIERKCHIATKDLHNYSHGKSYDDILILFVEAWPKTKFVL